jgi:hypothetical protein
MCQKEREKKHVIKTEEWRSLLVRKIQLDPQRLAEINVAGSITFPYINTKYGFHVLVIK